MPYSRSPEKDLGLSLAEGHSESLVCHPAGLTENLAFKDTGQSGTVEEEELGLVDLEHFTSCL